MSVVIENNNYTSIQSTASVTNSTDNDNLIVSSEEEHREVLVQLEKEEQLEVNPLSSTLPSPPPPPPPSSTTTTQPARPQVNLSVSTTNTTDNYNNNNSSPISIQDEEFNLPSSTSLLSVYSTSSLLEDLSEAKKLVPSKFSFTNSTRFKKDEEDHYELLGDIEEKEKDQQQQQQQQQRPLYQRINYQSFQKPIFQKSNSDSTNNHQSSNVAGRQRSFLTKRLSRVFKRSNSARSTSTPSSDHISSTAIDKKSLPLQVSSTSSSYSSSSVFGRLHFGYYSKRKQPTDSSLTNDKITSSNSTYQPKEGPVVIQEEDEAIEEGIESALLVNPKVDYSSTDNSDNLTSNPDRFQVQIYDTKEIIATSFSSSSTPTPPTTTTVTSPTPTPLENSKSSIEQQSEQEIEQHQQQNTESTSHMNDRNTDNQEHKKIIQNNLFLEEEVEEEDEQGSNEDSDLSLEPEGEDYRIEPRVLLPPDNTNNDVNISRNNFKHQHTADNMGNNNLRMDISASSISPTNSLTSNTSSPIRRSGISGAFMCRTRLSRCLYNNSLISCVLSIRTISDYVPSVPQSIMENSKTSFLGLLVACFVLNLLFILPGYMFSFLITEVGVYTFTVISIWSIGRFVLRLIAFPGSTSRVSSEIETEFTKYSLRMLESSLQHVIEFCLLIISTEDGSMYSQHSAASNGSVFSPKKSAVQRLVGKTGSYVEIVSSWKKVAQYRNRVLGMFFDVLHCLLHENGQGEAISEDDDFTQVRTKYSNNTLIGDIGNLSCSVTKEGIEDGQELYKILKRVLSDMDILERRASDVFKSNPLAKSKNSSPSLTAEAFRAAQKLLISATELNDMIPRLSLQKLGNLEMANDTDEERAEINTSHTMLGNNSVIAAVASTIEALVSLFDPAPHQSIFGLDVLRGTMLSRYQGARQLWCPRPKSEGGGMIDVIHIPADVNGRMSKSRHVENAVLFCNPNAGLIEVATGISLIGGNVGNNSNAATSWADFYIENGFDIFLFNYSGFGRSHMGSQNPIYQKSRSPCSIMGRIFHKSLFGSAPSPSSLKADALIVANFMIKEFTVDNMIIHGESIGGMAAASTARKLSTMEHTDEMTSVPKAYPTLLICDRTFCNLKAVASHLVGSWTGVIIPILAPFWNTDVAGDFIAATCKKVVAQDAADAIIHYSSSLQKGIAAAKELRKGITKGLEHVVEAPLHYRMADFENVGVTESKHTFPPKMLSHIQAPVWPSDKHVDFREAIHFAACARRIGKVATLVQKRLLFTSLHNSMNCGDEEGIEITAMFSRDDSEDSEDTNKPAKRDPTLEVWEILSRCDGLTGLPLGVAIKEGDDCVIDWLSSLTIFGGQRIVGEAKKRSKSNSDVEVIPADFDVKYCDDRNGVDEDNLRLPPLPLPNVITALNQMHQNKNGLHEIEKELEYCIKMLEYVVTRLSASVTAKSMSKIISFQDSFDSISTGRFLNLSCGHNNQFSVEEKVQLCNILTEACDNSNSLA